MDYCRVVGPRGLCRPLDGKQGPLAPCQGCSKAEQSRTTFRGFFCGALLGPTQKALALVCPPHRPKSLELAGRPLKPAQKGRDSASMVADKVGAELLFLSQGQLFPGPWILPAQTP